MNDITPSLCRSCGQLVYWLTNERTGKLAPIDAVLDDAGNVLADLDARTYRIASKAERGSSILLKRTNHFQTCPSAKQWAKRGAR